MQTVNGNNAKRSEQEGLFYLHDIFAQREDFYEMVKMVFKHKVKTVQVLYHAFKRRPLIGHYVTRLEVERNVDQQKKKRSRAKINKHKTIYTIANVLSCFPLQSSSNSRN